MSDQESGTSEFIKKADAVRILQSSQSQYSAWVRKGLLPATKTVPQSVVVAFQAKITEDIETNIGIDEAARMLGKSVQTLQGWRRDGKIKKVNTDHRKGEYFSRAGIKKLLTQPLPRATDEKCRSCGTTSKPIYHRTCLDCFRQSEEKRFYDLYSRGSTLQDIGVNRGISRERVRQIIARAEKTIATINDVSDSSWLHAATLQRNKGNALTRTLWYQSIYTDPGKALAHASESRSVKSFMSDYKIPQSRLADFRQAFPSVYRAIRSRWSTEYDECKSCGLTRNKHRSYGYCTECYWTSAPFKELQKKSYLKHIDKRKRHNSIYLKEYYKRPEVVQRLKVKSDNELFSGNRDAALEQGGFRCTVCGISRDEQLSRYGKDLKVRHLDNDKDNNNLENLAAMCDSCFASSVHTYRHAQKRSEKPIEDTN